MRDLRAMPGTVVRLSKRLHIPGRHAAQPVPAAAVVAAPTPPPADEAPGAWSAHSDDLEAATSAAVVLPGPVDGSGSEEEPRGGERGFGRRLSGAGSFVSATSRGMSRSLSTALDDLPSSPNSSAAAEGGPPSHSQPDSGAVDGEQPINAGNRELSRQSAQRSSMMRRLRGTLAPEPTVEGSDGDAGGSDGPQLDFEVCIAPASWGIRGTWCNNVRQAGWSVWPPGAWRKTMSATSDYYSFSCTIFVHKSVGRLIGPYTCNRTHGSLQIVWMPYPEGRFDDPGRGVAGAPSHFPWPLLDLPRLRRTCRRAHLQRQQALGVPAPQAAHALAYAPPWRHREDDDDCAILREGHCLRVDVVRAEALPRADTFGACDPYCIVTAQSEAGLQMFKGKTISDSQVRLTAVASARRWLRRVSSPLLTCRAGVALM